MVRSAVIERKQRRFAESGELKLVDLFAGCGGFSLGFQRAGMQVCGAIEQDAWAARSHANNFFRGDLPGLIEEHAQPRDITKTDPCEFIRELAMGGRPNSSVDVLVGGPPCQAFARIGRAKLREIASHPHAHRRDDRANLFREFIRFAEALAPLAIVVENVPDMMNHGGVNIAAEMCRQLSDLGYQCRYTLMNAVHYGVPQFRDRVFIIAYHQALKVTPLFPKPSHQLELPTGYAGTRSVAMKPIVDSGEDCDWFCDTRRASQSASDAVTCREALSDLPEITAHLRGEMKRGARCLDCSIPYPRRKRLTNYAMLMRTWKGFENSASVTGHVIRNLPRDFETFERMRPGDQYPEAYDVAVQRFDEKCAGYNGHAPRKGSKAYQSLWESIVPPYDPGKFPNKWWKLQPRIPLRTLTAHIGKDTYSHIHYDGRQARTISVREAARLQSFPDGFQFAGAMNAAFRQVGNAVPPLIAFAIARQIRRQLKLSCRGL